MLPLIFLPPAVTRHRNMMAFQGKAPFAQPDAFVAPNATVVGDVYVGDRSVVMYDCVLRGASTPHAGASRTKRRLGHHSVRMCALRMSAAS